jgi:hypothetical protein
MWGTERIVVDPLNIGIVATPFLSTEDYLKGFPFDRKYISPNLYAAKSFK